MRLICLRCASHFCSQLLIPSTFTQSNILGMLLSCTFFFLQSDKITSSVLFIRVFRRLCPFVLCRAGSRWLATLATVALRWWSGERHRDETRQSEHAYGHILWTVVEIQPESFAKNFTFHSPAALNNFDTSSSGL